MRTFNTGASRDTSHGKADYSYRHPAVEQEVAFYMMRHSVRPDGSIRPMNNWWKGIPFSEGLKSLERHISDVHAIYHGLFVYKERKSENGEDYEYTHYLPVQLNVQHPNWLEVSLKDAICGCIFNGWVCLLAVINKENESK